MTMPSTIIVEFGPEIDNSDDPNYMDLDVIEDDPKMYKIFISSN